MPIIKNPLQSPAAESPQPRQQKTIQWALTQPQHTMADLILPSATHTQLLDVISYFQNQDLLFHQWGLEEHFAAQSGLAVNLYGPPGTGKTIAAHAIASAFNCP